MKVRARIKTPDHMPEWAKCCPEGLRIIQQAQGREYVVDTSVRFIRGCFCLKCDGGAEETTAVLIVSGGTGRGNLIMLEWLDLDEAPFTELAAQLTHTAQERTE